MKSQLPLRYPNCGYDDSDNLISRSDARVGLCGVSSQHVRNGSAGYDALNRPIQKRYTSSNTPPVMYSYDQDLRRTGDLNPNYWKERLTSITAGSNN